MFRNVKNYYPSKIPMGFKEFKGYVVDKPPTEVKEPAAVPPVFDHMDMFDLVRGVENREGESKITYSRLNKLYDSINFIKKTLEPPLYKGEVHATLKTGTNPDGSSIYTKGAWIGPGIDIDKRLGKTKPKTQADAAAMRHDLAFALHDGDKSIRQADKTFLDKVNGSNDYPINKIQANLIVGKLELENAGLLSRKKFAGDGRVGLSNKQISEYEAELARMKQAGYGKKTKKGWGEKDIKKYKRSLRKKPGDRLLAGIVGKKKNKTKIPKKYQKKIKESMALNQQFNDAKLPPNLASALEMMG